MRTSRPLTLTAAAVSLALLVGGCASRPDRADTITPAATATPAAGATVEPTAEPTTEPTPAPTAEPVALTQVQIDQALLTQDDVPEGWVLDDSRDPDLAEEEPVDDVVLVTDPAECGDLAGLGEDTSEEEPVASGSVSFSVGDWAFAGQRIETWDSGVDADELDELVAALSACAEYTQTHPDGSVTTNTLSALDLPSYGDRTLAVRITTTGGEGAFTMTFTVDVVMIAAGRTSITLMAGGLGEPLDTATLGDLAATAVAKVNAAA